jgi:tetratricopeptide (TPR) repeat protein/transcriptional regulator with XRE-family HTH domain
MEADGAGASGPVLAAGKLETTEDLGYALRQLRRRCRQNSGSKLTYRDLAERTGYSRSAIGNWLAGKSLPSADRLDDLAGHLGATQQEQRILARAREEIDEGRGVTPGPALAPDGPSAVPPRQLPRGNPKFTGRADDLEVLTALLGQPDTATVVVLVTGTAGIGKTALALHWAHQHRDQFPDGQLWLDLQGFDPSGDPLPPDVALRGFLHALGVAPAAIPADPQARSALYRSLMAGRRILVILDNARDISQVVSLLPGGAECAVMITSRHQLSGLVTRYGAQSVDLSGLAEDEAAQLLTRYLGASRLTAEPGAVASLLADCGGLPLAISIVAARAGAYRRLPLAALAAELREAATRLDALDAGDLTTSVRAVLSWSFHPLDVQAATAVRLLGLAPGPDISLAAVAALTGLPASTARSVLHRLEAASLLRQEMPGRYRMHDLIRLYAADQARRDLAQDERLAALRRVTDFYVHTAYAGDRLLAPHRPPVDLAAPAAGCAPGQPADAKAALTWFDAEHLGLLAALQLAAAQAWHTRTWQLAWALNTFHLRRGYLLDRVAAWRAGLAAAEKLGQPAIRILAHRWLGSACAEAGQHELARDHLGQAITLAEATGDITSQAHGHQMLAGAWGQQGNYAEALDHAMRTFGLAQSLGDPVREADALNVVGWSQAHLGHLEQARASCEPALELYRRNHDREGEAATLHNLGYIEGRAGEHEQAIRYFGLALALCRDLGNAYREAQTLEDLAEIHAACGQDAEARWAWQQALSLHQSQRRVADVTRIQQRLDTLRRSLA